MTKVEIDVDIDVVQERVGGSLLQGSGMGTSLQEYQESSRA